MADAKLTALTAASALDGTELVYGSQGGNSRKVTTAQIKTYTNVPAGSTTQVQYNNAGALAGSANFTVASGGRILVNGGWYYDASVGYYLADGVNGFFNLHLNMVASAKIIWSSGANANTGADTALVRNGAGVVKVTNNSTGAGVFTTQATTVAGLPSAATAGAGGRGFVTDASTTLILGLGTTVTGGGANSVPVYSDGSNWLYG